RAQRVPRAEERERDEAADGADEPRRRQRGQVGARHEREHQQRDQRDARRGEADAVDARKAAQPRAHADLAREQRVERRRGDRGGRVAKGRRERPAIFYQRAAGFTPAHVRLGVRAERRAAGERLFEREAVHVRSWYERKGPRVTAKTGTMWA